jgi:hypothetical protein
MCLPKSAPAPESTSLSTERKKRDFTKIIQPVTKQTNKERCNKNKPKGKSKRDQ